MESRFGTALDDALIARGWTQGQLETRTEYQGEKVSQSTISRIISGVMSPTIEVAVSLARALDASLDEMCGLAPLPVSALSPQEAEIIERCRKAGRNEMVLAHLGLLIDLVPGPSAVDTNR